MYPVFINNIEKHIPLSASDKELVLSVVQFKKIKKKSFFIQEHEISQYSAFVLNGCMRSFFVDVNGFEHNLQFAVEDWWISDMTSFTTQKPGRLYIEALENSEVLLLSRESQLKLFNKCPKFEKYFRILTENGLVSFQNRLLDNMSLPAMDRYIQFVEKYPQFLKRLPQIHIAAFLGITPEFLSKLRHQLAKGNH